MTILDLQMALKAAGFDPGPLDGIPGPKTRAAIRGFQRHAGLEVDGIAGPITQSRLFAPAAANVFAALPWLRSHGAGMKNHDIGLFQTVEGRQTRDEVALARI